MTFAAYPALAESQTLPCRRACDLGEGSPWQLCRERPAARWGERGFLPEQGALLARALYEQGQYEKADRVLRAGEEAAYREHLWGATRAKLLARARRFEEVEHSAREVAKRCAEGDELVARADVLIDLAEVLVLASRPEEAIPAVREAIELYERKGVAPAVGRARARVAELEAFT